jgi:hypothetical protein
MAKVQAQVAGGSIVQHEASTVAELRTLMNLESTYGAHVNGEPEEASYELEDYQMVTFAQQTKGA